MVATLAPEATVSETLPGVGTPDEMRTAPTIGRYGCESERQGTAYPTMRKEE